MPTPFSTAPWPHHEPDELHAVQQVLASGKTNYWTGGEGGLIATDGDTACRSALAHTDHGKNYEAIDEHEHPSGRPYVHDSFSTY